ncbi:MAG: hypothetical protein COV99_01960 [Bacteroidetes bacterium CG12_big_fil_rev_8_21_14_0_65_60_17]|nr:MAG: hypothetical protein COV99_01960 [Bacteroidetes bacterium CG12_big_fil_rev_8_21_14_0_65_60_17]
MQGVPTPHHGALWFFNSLLTIWIEAAGVPGSLEFVCMTQHIDFNLAQDDNMGFRLFTSGLITHPFVD